MIFLSGELAIDETAMKFHRTIFVPLPDGAIRHEAKKTALEIARLRTGVPSGLGLLVSIGPVLGPYAAVIGQVMGPDPKQFPVRQPERFLARLCKPFLRQRAININGRSMLGMAIFIKISFPPVEQITPIRTNPRAPDGTGVAIRKMLGEIFDHAAIGFGCEIAGCVQIQASFNS